MWRTEGNHLPRTIGREESAREVAGRIASRDTPRRQMKPGQRRNVVIRAMERGHTWAQFVRFEPFPYLSEYYKCNIWSWSDGRIEKKGVRTLMTHQEGR